MAFCSYMIWHIVARSKRLLDVLNRHKTATLIKHQEQTFYILTQR